MEELKKIIRDELEQLIFENEDSNFFTRHPIFSNPEKAAEYAIEYMEKYDVMKRFYDNVSRVIWNSDLNPDKKLNEILKLVETTR